MQTNRLILGDNLDVLKTLPDESIDLCYIDPPFFSRRNYEVIWGDAGEVRSFTDRWSGGMIQYISWLKDRIDLIWKKIKSTGSLCVHCDWHANAYIRVMILDKLGGEFVNEITWCYTQGGRPVNKCPNKHDTIYIYAKSKTWTFNAKDIKIPFDLYSLKSSSSFTKIDDDGRKYKEVKGSDNKLYRYYEDEGKIPYDWWIDIPKITGRAAASKDSEWVGYPTQKPIKLMERIIKALSNEGDVVLDAFCGGGTTCVSAFKLKRKFIGIDQSAMAIGVSRARLENTRDLLYTDLFTVETHKYDYDLIRKRNAFDFERFIIEKFGGEAHYTKQVGDLGIDGQIKEEKNTHPIQVKRSDNIGRNVVDNFKSAMTRFNKDCKKGYIIAFSFGRGAVEEVARLKLKEDIEIKLVRVDEIIPIAPKIKINVSYDWKDAGDKKEITFTATGEGVELWQWDWDYNEEKEFAAEVLMDKEGKQTITLGAGKYDIAVRGISEDGAFSTEIIHLVINGGVHNEKA